MIRMVFWGLDPVGKAFWELQVLGFRVWDLVHSRQGEILIKGFLGLGFSV